MSQHSSIVIVIACAAALSTAAPSRALAQARPEAEQLFRDGKRLMKEGKFADACSAFEASEKAEPNLSTLMSLADCHEKAQQYASAWARFLAAESRARGDAQKHALERTARKRAAVLEARLSYLTVSVPDESRVPGLVVMRDGLELDPGQWNRAVPLDGGAHVITGKAPGHEPWQTTVELGVEADKRSVEVPRFKALPTLVSPVRSLPAPEEPATVTSELPPVSAQAEPSPWSPRRKLALGIAAGGVVAAGAGIGFGLAARSARSDALATCPPAACTETAAAAAQEQNDRARRHALLANVGYAVAGAAAVGAVVLWFTAKPERRSSLALAPALGESQGLVVTGGF